MSFGQQSGPPATAKQLAYLEKLLADAGYTTFRDARHPLGLTQRQSAGRFTRQEASDLIDRLAATPTVEQPVLTEAEPPAVRSTPSPRRTAREQRDADRAELVRGMPDELLADELVRRGWSVSKP